MNINNLTSRSEKIKFLQEIEAGKISLNKFHRLEVELWADKSNTLGFFVNTQTKEKLTIPQFQLRKNCKKQNKIYVEIIYPGNNN